MAQWKKVVVSGSNVSQLVNDAGYLTIATSPAISSFATMSINGISVIADSGADTLTFASSSGAGLNIVGDAGADSITFTLGNIPNTSLANSTISGKALGTNLDSLTAGSGLSGTAYNGSAAQTFSVNSGSMLPYYSGSIFSTVSGDITITSGGVATISANAVALGTDTTGDYVATITSGAGLTGGTTGEGSTPTLAVGAGTHITVNADDVAVNTTTLIPAVWAQSGSYTGSIQVTSAMIVDGTIVNNDINAAAAIAYTKLNLGGSGIVSGSSLSSATQGTVVLTTNGVAGTTVDLALETTDSPQFVGLTLTGDLAVNGGDITTTSGTATVFNTGATSVNAFGAATTLNLGNASGNTTIAGNAIVQGDFTVNGTTTYINVQDLYIEDRFILLASGSATAGDGGIIIDRGSDAAGNMAYGYDSITDRWGFQGGVADNTNTFDPTSAGGVSGSFVPYLFTEANHGATKPITGEFAVQGAIYTSTSGDVWMYA
jgi:hypothetical protein